MYPLYYSGSANFGDALNPILYKHITGRNCRLVTPDVSGKILTCGSIIQTALPGDLIWGAGLMSQDAVLKCDTTTQTLAVRGPLTNKLLPNKTEIFGDPGLLISMFIPASEKKQEIGIIPHYTDRDIVKSDPELSKYFIDVMGGVEHVIKCVTKCKLIISSALHGIICAEAYGIPAVWVEFSDNVAGNGFKFRDYYLGTGRDKIESVNWRIVRNYTHIMRIADNWQPPIFDSEKFLDACPFNWEFTDYKRWKNLHAWNDNRYKEVAKMIDRHSRIIEFGAGKGIPKSLLHETCQYTASDIYQRTPQVIKCDLNTGIYPTLSPYDTIVMIGVLEYIYEDKIIKLIQSAKYFNIKTFICSYEHEANQEINGYVNRFTREELINLFGMAGYKLKADKKGVYKFTL